MWALDHPHSPRTERFTADTPLAVLVVLALGAAATWLLVERGTLPPRAMRIAGVTAGHGALLATALAWAHVRPALVVASVVWLGLASAVAGAGALGPLAYLGPMLWILWLARDGGLAGLGLSTRMPLRALLAGAAAGALLALHLLVTASRTLGVHPRLDHWPEMLAAIGYDVGANVLAAECFFRGALFTRAQARRSFAVAVTGVTVVYVLRYLVDPLLPKNAGLLVGAVFYLSMLGAFNCWLLWWSASLLPGILSALIFFAAYRTLGSG
jgi:hypothetical protein